MDNLQTLTAVRWQNCVYFSEKNISSSVYGLMHDVALAMQHELHLQQYVQTCLN